MTRHISSICQATTAIEQFDKRSAVEPVASYAPVRRQRRRSRWQPVSPPLPAKTTPTDVEAGASMSDPLGLFDDNPGPPTNQHTLQRVTSNCKCLGEDLPAKTMPMDVEAGTSMSDPLGLCDDNPSPPTHQHTLQCATSNCQCLGEDHVQTQAAHTPAQLTHESLRQHDKKFGKSDMLHVLSSHSLLLSGEDAIARYRMQADATVSLPDFNNCYKLYSEGNN